MEFADTIFALASGPPPAGIAVIRISGPRAGDALRQLTGDPLPVPRQAVRSRFCFDGDDLDDGIVLWFPGPASFTGEDVAELHIHGGRASIDALTDALGAFDGLRLARPGEFTRRAFENDKLDLTRVEALADLITAETTAQRRQARRQLGGALARLYDGWRDDLMDMRARVEAAVDFSDEDIPEDLLAGLQSNILCLKEKITQHIDDSHRGERLRSGFDIAIIGAPNVGKSSLLNTLARRDAAIVSETAGTTRDVVEVHLDLGGLPVIIADTAGIRDSQDQIEEEGVRRTRARAGAADFCLAVFDATALPDLDPGTLELMAAAAPASGMLCVFNKADLLDRNANETISAVQAGDSPVPALAVSARTGEGMDALLAALEAAASGALSHGGGAPLTRARHREALMEAVAALGRVKPAISPELVAEELRLASRAVGRITGRVDVEDVLDRIFADFCIGK